MNSLSIYLNAYDIVEEVGRCIPGRSEEISISWINCMPDGDRTG